MQNDLEFQKMLQQNMHQLSSNEQQTVDSLANELLGKQEKKDFQATISETMNKLKTSSLTANAL